VLTSQKKRSQGHTERRILPSTDQKRLRQRNVEVPVNASPSPQAENFEIPEIFSLNASHSNEDGNIVCLCTTSSLPISVETSPRRDPRINA
jgi:hypothetical protein